MQAKIAVKKEKRCQKASGTEGFHVNNLIHEPNCDPYILAKNTRFYFLKNVSKNVPFPSPVFFQKKYVSIYSQVTTW